MGVSSFQCPFSNKKTQIMTLLNSLLDELETKIDFGEVTKPEVSKSNVAWHIEHCLLTINGITHHLAQSDPKNYSWGFNFLRTIIFFRKKIPRGRAKAPKVVQPKENITKESLKEHLLLSRLSIQKLANLPKNHYFKHPYFGNLKVEQTICFLEIHTQHHLTIIEDILKTEAITT